MPFFFKKTIFVFLIAFSFAAYAKEPHPCFACEEFTLNQDFDFIDVEDFDHLIEIDFSNEKEKTECVFHIPSFAIQSYKSVLYEDKPLYDFAVSYENESLQYFTALNDVLVFVPSVNWRMGKGKSYPNGYESFDSFLSYYRPDSGNAYFVDLNFLRIGEGRFGMNSLIGMRGFTSDRDKIIGAYIGYDHRHLYEGDINQFALGAEFLSPCLELRVNGYIPFKKRRVFLDSNLFSYSGDYFAIANRYAWAMWGVDVEIAKRIFATNCFELDVGLGPYFYGSNCCNSLVGGMGRITSSLWNKLFLEVYTSYDHLFHFIAQGQISFYIPFSSACEWWKCIFRPVYRNRVIVTEEICCWKTNF